jgi:hypothetical protein
MHSKVALGVAATAVDRPVCEARIGMGRPFTEARCSPLTTPAPKTGLLLPVGEVRAKFVGIGS